MTYFRSYAFDVGSISQKIPDNIKIVLIFGNLVLFIILYGLRIFMMVPWIIRLGGTGTFDEKATYVLVFAFVQAVFDAAMLNLLACYFTSLKVDSPVLRAVMRRSIAVAIWTIPILQVVGYFQWR